MIDLATRSRLLELSPVQDGCVVMTRECKLCHFPAHHFCYVDFNKSCNEFPLGRSGLLVEYFRCQRCELLFTDFFDRWSLEQFAEFIYNDEYTKVDPEYLGIRPLRCVEDIAPSLEGAEDLRILDYGSGSGLFADGMRQRGFTRCESFDPISDQERPVGKFSIITSFDVIEHSPDPEGTLADMLSYLEDDGCLLVGQTLQPANMTSLRGDWWYMAPRNGHMTLYSPETLHVYAERMDLCFDDFGDLFSISRPGRSALSEKIIERRGPQKRRVLLAAPSAAEGSFSAWHLVDESPSGPFRWTRERRVDLGTHETAAGYFRVVLRHLGKVSDAFLADSVIEAGPIRASINVHEGDLFAVLDFPDAGKRNISLLTPSPVSSARAGTGDDEREVGIAICCGPLP